MQSIREVISTQADVPASTLILTDPTPISDANCPKSSESLGADGPETSGAARSETSGADRPGVGRVRKDLERLGPGQTIPALALDEAFAYCQQLATEHYENFSVASLLAPRSIRKHLASIYAYCRWSDDLADEMGDPSRAQLLLEWWGRELDACFAGHATHPVFIALRHSIAVHSLPKEPFSDLLSAFVQDQTITRYESDTQLLDYCRRSANPVGRLVLQLGQSTTPEAVELSDSICTGLQLANFCQDIRVDAVRGRIYMPQCRRDRFHVQEAMLLNGNEHDAMRQALESWVVNAREFLIRGLPLVRLGPRWLARSVQLFVRGGLALLDNIERNDFNVWTNPVTVSRNQKLSLMAHALFRPRSLSLQRDPASADSRPSHGQSRLDRSPLSK